MSCYQRNIKGDIKPQCVSCSVVPTNTRCDHCLSLFTRQRIELKSKPQVDGFSCIKCECMSWNQQLYCSYGHESSCYGLEVCEKMVQSYVTGQSKYECKNCIDASGRARVIYVPFRKWSVTVGDQKVVCYCTKEGEITCSINRWISSFSFSATCRNCSYYRAQIFFKEPKSKLNSCISPRLILQVSIDSSTVLLQIMTILVITMTILVITSLSSIKGYNTQKALFFSR